METILTPLHKMLEIAYSELSKDLLLGKRLTQNNLNLGAGLYSSERLSKSDVLAKVQKSAPRDCASSALFISLMLVQQIL